MWVHSYIRNLLNISQKTNWKGNVFINGVDLTMFFGNKGKKTSAFFFLQLSWTFVWFFKRRFFNVYKWKRNTYNATKWSLKREFHSSQSNFQVIITLLQNKGSLFPFMSRNYARIYIDLKYDPKLNKFDLKTKSKIKISSIFMSRYQN